MRNHVLKITYSDCRRCYCDGNLYTRFDFEYDLKLLKTKIINCKDISFMKLIEQTKTYLVFKSLSKDGSCTW